MNDVPALFTEIDVVLATTRAVRKRLDLSRPVDDDVLATCLRFAVQAPTASYSENWHFLLVRDQTKKDQLAGLYRQAFAGYRAQFGEIPETKPTLTKVVDSAAYLAEHLHEVPVLVVPLVRRAKDDHLSVASMYGSIVPAVWSFMLAARSRGLGTAYTTLHLAFAEKAAEILGIDHDRWVQTALIPVAYTIGTAFAPGPRKPLGTVVSVDTFGQAPTF